MGLSVVVLDALAAPPDPALRAALGPELHDVLRATLRRRVLAWARAAGGGTCLEAREAQELPGLLSGHDGSVAVVAPDVPVIDDDVLAGALDDLAAGVTFALAPSVDGSPYLVVLDRPDPEMLLQIGQDLDRSVIGAVMERGGSFGMLRAERRLATLSDARALRADPLAPVELKVLLPATV